MLLTTGLLTVQKAFSAPAVPEVAWYPIETERSAMAGRARIIISGKTTPNSMIKIDGESITMMRGPKTPGSANSAPNNNIQIESADATSNAEGYFEIAMNLPPGLLQLPVEVFTPAKTEKTFLLTFEVNVLKEQVRMNTKATNRKPPAAAKKFRLWMGAGWTYQSFHQTTTGSPELKFQTVQAPGIVARGGYWGDNWGVDLYFRDAPGKIEADQPFQVQSDSYHWTTAEVKGLYQIERDSKSRIFGLASQWQVRFGTQMHETPFLTVDNANLVTLEKASLTTATLGVGLLLGQERDWTYEFAFGLQQPISAKGPGSDFKASSAMAYEAQVGAAYKFAPNWRLGVFSYMQSMSYNYEFQNAAGVMKSGKQNLFYTTFDLRLGYEF